MSSRRELGTAISLCGAGAALVVFAAGRHWVDFPSEVCAGVGCGRLFEAGTLQQLVRALGVASAAGVVAVLASRGRGRQLVGVLLAIMGCAVVVAGVRARQHPETPTGVDVVQIAPASLSGTSLAPTAWPLVAAVGGVGVLLAGGLVAARGRSWTRLSGRYDGPQAEQAPSGADSEAALWDAQSRGEDPT